MNFVVQLVIAIVLAVISYVLAPKPAKPQPGTLQGVPIADQGTPIAVVFGTRLVKQPVVTWWGDVRTEAIRVKSK